VIIIVVMHELASAFLIADRMLLIDKSRSRHSEQSTVIAWLPERTASLTSFQRAKIPLGSKLKGVEILVERCCGAASKTSLVIVIYTAGPHEMLNKINRVEALANLLGWISALLEKQEPAKSSTTARPSV
jgi:hypothetical protein